MPYPYYGYQFQNNMFPVQDQLQQLRSQPQQQMMTTQMQGPSDDRIFVQGKIAAQAYLVAPNGFVRLWDSLDNVFYEKYADASGRPYMEEYEYHKKTQNQTNEQQEVKKHGIDYGDQIKALDERVKALESMKGDVAHVSKSDSDDTNV